MQKLETMCKNVGSSDAQNSAEEKEIGVGNFVHMKENTTTEATEWNYYKATGDKYHTHKKCKNEGVGDGRWQWDNAPSHPTWNDKRWKWG